MPPGDGGDFDRKELIRTVFCDGNPHAPLSWAFPCAGSPTIGWKLHEKLLPCRFAEKTPRTLGETNLDLEPSLLVVTCERLKSHFHQELGLDDEWKGKVSLLINPALAEGTRPQLTAEYHPDGWRYNIALPKTITKRLLVRVIVDTLFLEIANRNAGSHGAQIPFWLYEGMGAHLQSFTLPTDLLQPSEQMAGANFRLKGLETVRQELRENPPLSFQQLSWPTEADADGPDAELFLGVARNCSSSNCFSSKTAIVSLRKCSTNCPAITIGKPRSSPPSNRILISCSTSRSGGA